jgi:hypothetical protein
LNLAPDAAVGNTTGAFGTPVAVDLLGNDSDPDGDPLTIVSASVDPAQGTVAFDGTDWVFTPASGFTGTATIAYTVQDQDGATDTATHTVVVALPPAPVAVNDIFTTTFGQSAPGDVTGNDTFLPGSVFSALTQPLGGTLVFNADGTYLYTPAPGFMGTDTFVYRVTDPAGQTAFAVEVLRVAPPALLAVNDSSTTSFGTAVSGNAAANDTYAPGATFFAITAPAHGTVAMNADGTYVYTPASGFHGTDMFAYAVTDAAGQTRFATASITVSPPPAPVAVDDSYATAYEAPVTGNAASGDTFAPGATFAAVTQPTHGALLLNADGTFTYTPAAGFAGTDSFTYRVTDPNGQSATATGIITVSRPVLTAVDDTYSSVYGSPVSGNAAAGDTFAPGSTFAVETGPAHGTVTMGSGGTYSYTPAAGFTGTDTFTYRVTDPTGQTAIATETIVITPPVLIAADDSGTTAYNTPLNGNVAANDTVPPGSVFAVTSPPSVGTLSMSPGGTFTYTPPPAYAGAVTFTYQVTDPTGQSRTAVQTIAVSSPGLVAVNDSYTTPFGTTLNANAAAGDTFVPGSVFTAVTSPAHGSVTMNANGTYQYVPAASFTGIDTFTYRITDPTGQTATATETIEVRPRAAVHTCLTTFGSLRRR